MKESKAILKRQGYRIRFKNEDMDFIFNWMIGVSQIVGLSASQLFYAVHGMKDGSSKGWRDGFTKLGAFQKRAAEEYKENKQHEASGQSYLGAAYAYRAALQYTDPAVGAYNQYVHEMEDNFQKGVRLMSCPIREIDVPFENTTLPGYYLELDDKPRPVLVMIGGGDTFREDLFYFAGYPGWQRGYHVLMVDLPGQGKLPGNGQHFRVDMEKPIIAILDWLEANAAVKPEQIAIFGVSGGGYFSALGTAADKRIKAWIASTPIYDVSKVFRFEFRNVLKTPGWLVKAFMKIASSLSDSVDLSLKKYAWQFGMKDFITAANGVFEQAKPVDYDRITCPSLFLVGENEGEELKRQARKLYEIFKNQDQDVTLREFNALEGADAHCQVNHFCLLHLVVFDWLDRVFDWHPHASV